MTTVLLVKIFYPAGVIPTDLDDTLFHRSGRKVNGAGWWRDAVRSTGTKLVHAWGLNLVVLTLRIKPPWGGEPLGLPINMRLHRKDGPKLIDLAEEMLAEVARWLPEGRFHCHCNGFYASLAGRDIPNTHMTSRMRRDANIYQQLSKKKKKRRGRPRKRGKRLPSPEQMAKQVRSWKLVYHDKEIITSIEVKFPDARIDPGDGNMSRKSVRQFLANFEPRARLRRQQLGVVNLTD